MPRLYDNVPVETAAFKFIMEGSPTLFQHPRGHAAILLPGPDGKLETHLVKSTRVSAWISHVVFNRTDKALVLTACEIDRVALLLAAIAHQTPGPATIEANEDSDIEEVVLELVLKHVCDQKDKGVDTLTLTQGELVKSLRDLAWSESSGYSPGDIPDAPQLGRIMRRLVPKFKATHLDCTFARNARGRFLTLTPRAGWVNPPLIPQVNRSDSSNGTSPERAISEPEQLDDSSDGNDGNDGISDFSDIALFKELAS